MNFFGKSYNEIEFELSESKSRIQLLEEKIESLIQKYVEKSKILYETNNRIQLLEEKLQKNTSSLLSLNTNSITKFIDINCSSITISYNSPYDSGTGFIITIDGEEIQSKSYTIKGICKVINELKNIDTINFLVSFPIEDEKNKPSNYLIYFRGYFDIIKKIIKINNCVKIIMSFTSDFPFKWFKYMFNDLHIDNILGIEIFDSYSIDTEQITDIIKGLDKKLNKKIMFKSQYVKPIDSSCYGL
jgi:hypothetical protein